MIRQDYLESLVKPDLEQDALVENRAIVNFIDHLILTIKPNLEAQVESIKREQSGRPPLNSQEGDPYIEISPDLDAPRGLTTVK